jgi:hypothetical protein
MAKKKPAREAVGKKRMQAAKAAHNHELPLQEKLKDKNWDPIREMMEITDEYEAGTPKRESDKDYWGACCLESQDVDVTQKARRPDGPVSSADVAQKTRARKR